jgi:hypothetical protein
MGKQLIFKTDKDYPFSVVRLDRKKLYGWKDSVAYDENREECIRADIDGSGSFIIPKGGKGLGILDKDGNWVEKKTLKAVYKDGTDAVLLPSVFDQPVRLEKTVSVEEFLDHVIYAVYILEPSENAEELIEQIKQSEDIFIFSFNYRGGYEASPAFLLENKGTLFVLVGYPSAFEFVGLEQLAEFGVEDEEDEAAAEDEELDFSMM